MNLVILKPAGRGLGQYIGLSLLGFAGLVVLAYALAESHPWIISIIVIAYQSALIISPLLVRRHWERAASLEAPENLRERGAAMQSFVCRLYLSTTVAINLSLLLLWPARGLREVAAQCLVSCLLPVLWGVYVPLECHRSLQGLCVSATAALGSLFWMWNAVGLARMILEGQA